MRSTLSRTLSRVEAFFRNDDCKRGYPNMTDTHPSDRQLAAWVDASHDERLKMPISDHLVDCPSCLVLVRKASAPIPLPNISRLAMETLGPLEELVPDEPEQGQVWRVRWEDTSQLAMVWSADIDWVAMIPVTPDAAYADDSCVILTTEAPDGHSVLWLGLETPLPYHVLDAQVSYLPTDHLDAARRLFRKGKPIDTVELAVGQPIMSSFDDRYLYRSALAEDFEILAESHWAPAESGGNLRELAKTSGVEWSAVTDALQIEAPERLRISRGLRPLTMSEAQRLVELLNVEVSAVIRCNPEIDPDLVLALSRPRWRTRIDQQRRSRGEDEVAGRVNAAYEVQGLAARAPAPADGEPAWHERIKLYFAA